MIRRGWRRYICNNSITYSSITVCAMSIWCKHIISTRLYTTWYCECHSKLFSISSIHRWQRPINTISWYSIWQCRNCIASSIWSTLIYRLISITRILIINTCISRNQYSWWPRDINNYRSRIINVIISNVDFITNRIACLCIWLCCYRNL